MGGLSGLAGMFGALVPTPGVGLPALPGNLGLPEKSNATNTVTRGGRDDHTGFVGNSQLEKYNQEYAKAETYNKAFADLLNAQPQLNGNERKQLYDAYSDKFTGGNAVEGKGAKKLTDYSSILSALTPDQFAAQQKAQQQQTPAAQAQAAAQPAAPAKTAAPQTVGPVAAPQVVQPAPTPTVATAGGNIAGTTKTNNSDTKEKGGGRRGRMTTLLTGLGGAVEKFGA